MKPKIPNPSNLSNIRQAAEMALEVLEFYHLEHGTPSKKVLDAISVLRQAISYVDAINISQERVDKTPKREQEPEWIEDGYGTMWQKCGKKNCGKFVVKIGKVDCWNGDCPEAGIKK